jgi:hypothetical protein
MAQPAQIGIAAYLDGLAAPRQAEARALVDLFAGATGFAPQVWPGNIIGFGRYAYTYDSGHSGVSLASGFAPRKAELVLYINAGAAERSALLAGLGKHRLGKGCLYLRHLADADASVLRHLITAGLQDLAGRWPITPT